MWNTLCNYWIKKEIAMLTRLLEWWKPKPVHPAVLEIRMAMACQKQKARVRAGKGKL